MTRQVKSGFWKGRTIRTARKRGQCEYWRGRNNGGMCPRMIEPGDDYFEGELSGRAGGLAMQRYCMVHAADRE